VNIATYAEIESALKTFPVELLRDIGDDR